LAGVRLEEMDEQGLYRFFTGLRMRASRVGDGILRCIEIDVTIQASVSELLLPRCRRQSQVFPAGNGTARKRN